MRENQSHVRKGSGFVATKSTVTKTTIPTD